MIRRLAIFTMLIMISCHSSPRYGQRNSIRLKTKDASGKETKHRKSMTGVTSFYAEDFHGKVTANGETYEYGIPINAAKWKTAEQPLIAFETES